MFFALAYGAMGWVIATRVPRNLLGWLFMVMGLAMAAQMAVTFLVQQSHQAFRPMDPSAVASVGVSSIHLLSLVAASPVVFLALPRRAARCHRAGAARGLADDLALGWPSSRSACQPVGLAWYPSLPNLFSVPEAYAPLLTAIGGMGLALAVVGVVIAGRIHGLRYRHSHDEERAQIRWIAIAVLLIAGAGLPFVVARYALNMDYQTGELMLAIALAAGCFLPIAAAIAITRYRLYNIDSLINRALVYIPLTGILGGLYAAGVALFQRIFVAVTGDKSDAAIVLATLVLASLSRRSRTRSRLRRQALQARFRPAHAH